MGDTQHRRPLGSHSVATDCSVGALGALERAARWPLSLGAHPAGDARTRGRCVCTRGGVCNRGGGSEVNQGRSG